ncbi:MAG: lysophospholipid acyltransferase family protein [Sulfurovum sp.]|nr:lysophospholipid acyltransferase family protein [Sulfurovum sp.]
MKSFLRQLGSLVLPRLIYLFIRIIWHSTGKKFHYITPIDDRQHVCVTWHAELLMTPQAYRAIHKKHPASAIISSHFDGALIAKTLGLLKIRALRGSSRKGAKQVLFQAFKSIKSGEEVLITPDGPKGPRHSMGDGAVGIALKSKLPIFVMSFRASAYWELKSWDKFIIPKPFSRIDFYIQSLSLEGMSHEEAKRYLREKMLMYTTL